jgi:hypothetical protein
MIGRILILASVAGGPAGAIDVRARADEAVVLYAAIESGAGKRCVWATEAPSVRGPCRRVALSDAAIGPNAP